ncbi:hypothetical protein GPALN_010997 [Globodera pallida]|nr:hypothetical protein GPALN_010997 [Globodera pallida]
MVASHCCFCSCPSLPDSVLSGANVARSADIPAMRRHHHHHRSPSAAAASTTFATPSMTTKTNHHHHSVSHSSPPPPATFPTSTEFFVCYIPNSASNDPAKLLRLYSCIEPPV